MCVYIFAPASGPLGRARDCVMDKHYITGQDPLCVVLAVVYDTYTTYISIYIYMC